MTKVENKLDRHIRNQYKEKRRNKIMTILMIVGAVLVVAGSVLIIFSMLTTAKKYDENMLGESMYETEIKEIPASELPEKTPEEIFAEAEKEVRAEIEEAANADIFYELYEEEEEEFDGYLDIPLSHELQVEVFSDCDIYGVPYALAFALMETESSFREDIGNEDILGGEEGGARYYGYMQLSIENCLKAEEYGLNAHTPEGNIEMGIKILGNLLLDYDEEWEAITAYKGGAGYLESCKAKGIIPQTTQNVLAKKAKYEKMLKGEQK